MELSGHWASFFPGLFYNLLRKSHNPQQPAFTAPLSSSRWSHPITTNGCHWRCRESGDLHRFSVTFCGGAESPVCCFNLLSFLLWIQINLSHLTFSKNLLSFLKNQWPGGSEDLVLNEHMSLYSEENPMFTFLSVDILINNLSAMFALRVQWEKLCK